MNKVMRIIVLILCNLRLVLLEEEKKPPLHGTGVRIEVNDAVLTYGRVQGLIRHNILRCMHEAPPLELDPRVNGIAQDFAGILAAEGRFGHGGGFKVGGENLFATGCSTPDYYYPSLENVAETMVDAANVWHKEWKYYENNTRELVSSVAGHFTALVWKETKRLGLGFSAVKRYDAKSQAFTVTINVVGNYYPAGNGGDYEGNVTPRPTRTEEECIRILFRKSGADHLTVPIFMLVGLPSLLTVLHFYTISVVQTEETN